MYSSRKFLIFNLSEIDLVDFTQVLETSSSTVRKSVDGTKAFVKWDSEADPTFVSNLTTKEGPFTYNEILSILATSEWVELITEK